MRQILWVMLLCVLSWSAQAADRLTESMVRSLIDNTTAAIKKRDVEGVMKHFAPSARLELTLPASMGGGKSVMNVAEYRQLLRDGWGSSQTLVYKVEDLVVRVAPDAKTAEVSDTVLEVVEMGGQVIRSRTAEVATIALINGQPKVIRLVARSM